MTYEPINDDDDDEYLNLAYVITDHGTWTLRTDRRTTEAYPTVA